MDSRPKTEGTGRRDRLRQRMAQRHDLRKDLPLERISTPTQLDALPVGARLRFVGSGVVLTKTIADFWLVAGVKGIWTSEDICRNRNPMEVID